VERLLGEVEVAEEADQGGEDATGLRAVDSVDRRARRVDRVLAFLQNTGLSPPEEDLPPSIPERRYVRWTMRDESFNRELQLRKTLFKTLTTRV